MVDATRFGRGDDLRYIEDEPDSVLDQECPICHGELLEHTINIQGHNMPYIKCHDCKIMATEEAWEDIFYGKV